MRRMGEFQCTGLFASASKKGFHARLVCASAQRREYAPLFPPPTFCFEAVLEGKMGHRHSNHTGSKVAEMVLDEALRGGSCPHVWLQYFPPGTSDQAVAAGPSSLVLVQNPDQINVYSLGHCVNPPPPDIFTVGGSLQRLKLTER